MRARSLLFVTLAVWALVPSWTGDARLPLLGADAVVAARLVPLDDGDPARRRVGRLLFLGGVQLTSPDPAFGGFSAIGIRRGAVTLLSDGGNLLRFRLAAGQVAGARFGALPAGPGTGWRKRDRDSESLALDPATGTAWVGFERANAVWRYSPDLARAEASVRPPAMRRWRSNGGAETLVRRRDGSFIAIQELGAGATREALLWAGDPTAGAAAFAFRYRPPAGYDPTDATELPDGRLLILNRHWSLPLHFRSALVLVDPRTIRPGATVAGPVIARLAPPLIHANFEGVATTVERGRTIVWLVSDDDRSWYGRTLLLKFRLD